MGSFQKTQAQTCRAAVEQRAQSNNESTDRILLPAGSALETPRPVHPRI